MNRVILPNGNVEVGDYKFRMNDEYTNIVYIVTMYCNFRCKFCVGWNDDKQGTLIDKHSVEEVLDSFRYLQESSGRKLYVTLTGGEPSLVTDFGKFIKGLTEFCDVELQTNLCTKNIKIFAENANPERVGQVMASYHTGTVNKSEKLRDLYFENFNLLSKEGFTPVFKIIALPRKFKQLRKDIEYAKKRLPENAPIMIQPFIQGSAGTKENPTGYPEKYCEEDKRDIRELLDVRRDEVWDYITHGGWYKGMKCDAGRGFVTMDIKGNVYRCYYYKSRPDGYLGNLMDKSIKFLPEPRACSAYYCSTPFWALWFGFNPWDYNGKKREECNYCKFHKVKKQS